MGWGTGLGRSSETPRCLTLTTLCPGEQVLLNFQGCFLFENFGPKFCFCFLSASDAGTPEEGSPTRCPVLGSRAGWPLPGV